MFEVAEEDRRRAKIAAAIRRRLEFQGLPLLSSEVEREVADVCTLILNHDINRVIDTRRQNLQAKVVDLTGRLGEAKAKAVIYRKQATWWQQRYNRLRKDLGR